jgi:2-isopropylmalate synthase
VRRLIRTYDTTLRDGTQGEGIAFSVEDKLRIASRLDAIGVHYVEGGWPGSNPKDLRFFRRVQDIHFKQATLGVADNIIEASWRALVDAIEYRRDERRSRRQ